MGQLIKQFGKIKVTTPIPHLLTLQLDSYSKFLQEGVPADKRREDVGLEGVFRTVFPIEDFNKTASLEFESYEIQEPKYDQAECISKGLTYEAPVRIKVRLAVYDVDDATGERNIRDIKEQDIYFGTLPLMTEKGTFIVNGTERVIVNQLQRSPGIIFEHDGGKTHASHKVLYSCRVIPMRGSWLDFDFDHKDILYVRIDRRRKMPVTILFKAMGMSKTDILDYFYPKELRETYYLDVPEGMQEIMNKALAKRCEDRYANAGQMRRDLLNLKMKLFPFSSEDYHQELGAVKSNGNVVDSHDDGATVIMKPVRSELPPKQVTPAVTQEPEKIQEKQEAMPSEKTGDEKPVVKKKLNYTKLIVMITAAVVAISLVAHFIFNRNLAEIEVPNVTNMTVVEAQKLLEEKEFKVELEEKYGDPDKFKPGTVMEQSPKAGEKRKQGSLIILTICKGAELKAVPDVTGMSLSKAEQQLADAGFKVGKVTRKHVDGDKIGAVLSQSPKGLDKAPKGTAIDLVINEGDKPVPNIIGKSVDEAKGMLEQAGLKLGEIKKVQDANAKKNVVLACNPGVGSNLNDGAAVAITVAAGGDKKSAYVDFVVPSGKPANVRIVLTDDSGTATLYSGTQNGSVRLRQKVEYAGNAKVQFICDGKLISERNL